MRIHVLQHVPFEDEASIGSWAKKNGHTMSRTRLFKREELPSTVEFDLLLVMGGPMNIYEEKEYPFLAGEKKLIGRSVRDGKKVLGICLGAQLIADVLGGKVTRSSQKEIGWYPVHLTIKARKADLFEDIPESFTAFHWHGDTFSIPEGAVHIARSEACANQGFIYDGRVLALQFHLESTEESVGKLVKECSSDLTEGKFVEKGPSMLAKKDRFTRINSLMDRLITNFSKI